jgi:hypothetical protein
MAQDPFETASPPVSEPSQAPLAGSHSQSIQRLQVGLFGLAAMVLLVALANIIRNNADQNEATVVPEAATTVEPSAKGDTASDPLVDAGVIPEMPAEQPAKGNAPPPQP